MNQSLDTFLGTMTETMVANRQQIRTELEVRRLKRMLKLKEQQLADQRQLCSGTLHERLQGQYKAVVVARQSLATVTAQCREIGAVEVKDKEAGDGEEQGFRWVVVVVVVVVIERQHVMVVLFYSSQVNGGGLRGAGRQVSKVQRGD